VGLEGGDARVGDSRVRSCDAVSVADDRHRPVLRTAMVGRAGSRATRRQATGHVRGESRSTWALLERNAARVWRGESDLLARVAWASCLRSSRMYRKLLCGLATSCACQRDAARRPCSPARACPRPVGVPTGRRRRAGRIGYRGWRRPLESGHRRTRAWYTLADGRCVAVHGRRAVRRRAAAWACRGGDRAAGPLACRWPVRPSADSCAPTPTRKASAHSPTRACSRR
jgi:hypothetical protein